MIKAENLSFEYSSFDETDTPEKVLNGIDIDIKSGEFVAILGSNGSGKSTLARHLNALLTPTGGTLWVNGMDTKDPTNIWEVRRTTGMLFQNPDNQIVASIVEEDVAFGPENLGTPPEEIRKLVNTALKDVGIHHLKDKQPHMLSGGQKQRVAIAGVLAMRSSCIVLDEPTAMLDPSGRKEVLDAVLRLNKDYGITIILITHFMEEAAKAKRIIILEKGEVKMDGTPKEVFGKPDEVKALGLAVPKITELAFKLATKGIPIPTVLTVDEFIEHAPSFKITSKLDIAAMPSHPAIIEVKNLTHTYNPNSTFEKTALNNVSLEIGKGEFVAIIGHTGSGKSTLIQHFNGLLKPTKGSVYAGGEAFYKKNKTKGKSIFSRKTKVAGEIASAQKNKTKVGLVFQYPEYQLFESTILKDVSFGPVKMKHANPEAQARNALSLVGIPEEMFDRSPFDLSGGQKRRVAIAGVLAMEPEILILDEPAAGLDPKGKAEILSLLKQINKTKGTTVIIVSHSMDDAASLADRIIVMKEGQVFTQGTPKQVFSKGEALENMGLDTPEISKLFAKLENSKDLGIFSVEEAMEVLTCPE